MPPVASPPAVGEPRPPERADRPPPRRRRLSRRAWAASAVVVGVLASVVLWQSAGDQPAAVTRGDVERAVQRGLDRAQEEQRRMPPDAATAYRTIGPSLVTVTTERSGADTEGPAGTEVGLGSGVVINARGSILTALHVVAGGSAIRVRFADGTRASARVTGSQEDSDIAVLAVDRLPDVVVPAVLGGVPPVGDDVFAVGNPLGLQASLTAGVVSANDRSIRTREGLELDELIQFDAAVNPGNSGGPLLNRAGQVVGIVTGLANPTKQAYFVGIGFAVPIATAGGVAGGPQQ